MNRLANITVLIFLTVLIGIISGCCKTQTIESASMGYTPAQTPYGYLAPTPPMAWNSYYFAKDIDEAKIKPVADAMVSSGMREASYKYLGLDDAWMAAERDANGALQADPEKSPKGIKEIGDYIAQVFLSELLLSS